MEAECIKSHKYTIFLEGSSCSLLDVTLGQVWFKKELLPEVEHQWMPYSPRYSNLVMFFGHMRQKIPLGFILILGRKHTNILDYIAKTLLYSQEFPLSWHFRSVGHGSCSSMGCVEVKSNSQFSHILN